MGISFPPYLFFCLLHECLPFCLESFLCVDSVIVCPLELTEFVFHTDEEVEAMQATILTLQEQLRVANAQLQQHQNADGLHTDAVQGLPALKAENLRTGTTGNGVQCNVVSEERSFDDGGLDMKPLVVSKNQTAVNENGDAEGRTSGMMIEG